MVALDLAPAGQMRDGAVGRARGSVCLSVRGGRAWGWAVVDRVVVVAAASAGSWSSPSGVTMTVHTPSGSEAVSVALSPAVAARSWAIATT